MLEALLTSRKRAGQRLGGSGQRMGGSGHRLKKWAKGMFVGKGVISLGKEILFII